MKNNTRTTANTEIQRIERGIVEDALCNRGVLRRAGLGAKRWNPILGRNLLGNPAPPGAEFPPGPAVLHGGGPTPSNPARHQPDHMTNTKTTSRADQLRAALKSAESDHADARERLGLAVADDDTQAAAAAREDVSRTERLADELRAALPIADRRARKADQAEREAQRRAQEKAANKNRKARVAAARKVDAALRSLGKTYSAYLATETGGTGADAGRMIRRSRSAIASATLHAAPEFADALDIRRVMRAHRQSLEAAQSSITEFPEA